MDKYIQRARTLLEALPYIKEFNDDVIVIKYGGSAMIDEQLKSSVVQDIVLMKLVGIRPVVVHGGGNEISKMLVRLGKEAKFVNGLRVTDDETIEIAEMILSGKINKNIVQLFQQQGIKAAGISGKDGDTLRAVKMIQDDIDLGWVGEISEVNPALIKSLLDNDFVPIIASIASDDKGNTYNINADYAASAIAGALNAEKLIFLTDVEGVMKDVNDKSSLISKIYLKEIQQYIDDNIISGGMIPKIKNCAESINNGVSSVHILDGRLEHSLLLEIFTNSGIGTMILK